MFNLVSKLKNRRSLWPYFFEFFTVLLSVYLAFLITEWRESHKEKKETKIAIERLNQEIFQNYKAIIDFDKAVEKRLERMQMIEDIIEPKYNFFDYNPVFGGFRSVNFSNASWNRICDSKIGNLMPINYIKDTHALYNSNNNLTEHNTLISKIMFSDLSFDNKKCIIAYDIAKLYVWQQAVWGNSTINNYTEFIQKYRTDFQTLLQQDSATNAYFSSQDALSDEEWREMRKEKQQFMYKIIISNKSREIFDKMKAQKL